MIRSDQWHGTGVGMIISPLTRDPGNSYALWQDPCRQDPSRYSSLSVFQPGPSLPRSKPSTRLSCQGHAIWGPTQHCSSLHAGSGPACPPGRAQQSGVESMGEAHGPQWRALPVCGRRAERKSQLCQAGKDRHAWDGMAHCSQMVTVTVCHVKKRRRSRRETHAWPLSPELLLAETKPQPEDQGALGCTFRTDLSRKGLEQDMGGHTGNSQQSGMSLYVPNAQSSFLWGWTLCRNQSGAISNIIHPIKLSESCSGSSAGGGLLFLWPTENWWDQWPWQRSDEALNIWDPPIKTMLLHGLWAHSSTVTWYLTGKHILPPHSRVTWQTSGGTGPW